MYRCMIRWAVVALLVSGCGGTSDETPQAASTPSTSQAQPITQPVKEPAERSAAPVQESPSSRVIQQASGAEESSEPAEEPSEPSLEPTTNEVLPTEESQPQEAVARPSMPEVNLGRGGYAQSTLLKVGDTIPAITRSDLDGKQTSLDTLRGQGKLAVLLFWDSKTPLGPHALKSLQRYLIDEQGSDVKVIAINRGESATQVRKIVTQTGISFPVLLDEDAAVFSQFATSTVPRIYLVDAAGKILWLEVPFQGQTTIKTLKQAIAAAQTQ